MAATTGNGEVIFAGGSNGTALPDVEKYSLSGVRTSLSQMSVGRYNMGSASTGDGSVLFAGGYHSPDRFNIVEKYSIDGVRSTLEPLKNARANLVGVTNKEGNASYFVGGQTATVTLGDVDCYTAAGLKSSVLQMRQVFQLTEMGEL